MTKVKVLQRKNNGVENSQKLDNIINRQQASSKADKLI